MMFGRYEPIIGLGFQARIEVLTTQEARSD
jgi:hypothetical protein